MVTHNNNRIAVEVVRVREKVVKGGILEGRVTNAEVGMTMLEVLLENLLLVVSLVVVAVDLKTIRKMTAGITTSHTIILEANKVTMEKLPIKHLLLRLMRPISHH
mmetsp:Transcript_73916/g.205501  ORF Transcript_73916/g.205501 Transcript_73916/m.205501 type:complete len:105 (+) Transcript_73916:262-576(+)